MDDPHMPALAARIGRAADLMARRITAGDPVRLDELADAAALSKFHFHRMFRLLTGETPGEAMRRLRLAKAVELLRDPAEAITAAAHEAGFASSQALAKAFRQALAISPSELRRDPERLDAAYAALAAPQRPALLTLELAHRPETAILVTRHIGDPAELNAVYGMLFEVAGEPGNVAAILGFQHDDAAHVPPAEQVQDAALAVAAMPETLASGVMRERIAALPCLRLRHIGYDSLEPAVDRLTLLAIAAGAEPADAPVMFHYLDDPEALPEPECRADIYLPIAAR